MKHMKIDCHVVRDKTQAEVIKLLQINTRPYLVDLLTNALSSKGECQKLR